MRALSASDDAARHGGAERRVVEAGTEGDRVDAVVPQLVGQGDRPGEERALRPRDAAGAAGAVEHGGDLPLRLAAEEDEKARLRREQVRRGLADAAGRPGQHDRAEPTAHRS